MVKINIFMLVRIIIILELLLGCYNTLFLPTDHHFGIRARHTVSFLSVDPSAIGLAATDHVIDLY